MPADTGRYVFYISNCSFFIINQQKTLRQYMAYSIINLYWCIHLKAREQIGFNYRTPVFHDKICKRRIISRIPVLAWIDKREMPATVEQMGKFKAKAGKKLAPISKLFTNNRGIRTSNHKINI